MQIFVKISFERTAIIEIEDSDTIGVVKQKIQEKDGIPYYCQRLIFKGKEIYDDSETIKHYGIQNESTIFLYILNHHG